MSKSLALVVTSVLGTAMILAGANLFLVDPVIKWVAEAEMGKMHGAEINIGSVSHTLFPLSMTLTDIEVTDARRPELNQVEVQSVMADVAFMPLISGKVIVEQLDIVELAFNQRRTEHGEVYRPPGSSFSELLATLPNQNDIPSKDELLARSNLQTPIAIAAAQDTKEKYVQPLQEKYAALPDQEKLTGYKKTFNELKNTHYKNPAALLQAKEKWDKVKAKIKQDKALISEFSTLASAANKAIKENISALKSAPHTDYQALQKIMVGDPEALSRITYILFGDKAEQVNQTILLALDTVLPMLAPKPDEPEVVVDPNAKYANILIREANILLSLDDTSIHSIWQNITDQHTITKTPTTYTIYSMGSNVIDVQGEFSILPTGINAQQAWQIADITLENVPAVDSDRIQAVIDTAKMMTQGSLKITDNILKGESDIDLNNLALTATGTDKYSNIIAQTLNQLDALNLVTEFSGTVADPGFVLFSDLDNKLGKALISSLLNDQEGELAELRQSLQARTAESININEEYLDNITKLMQLVENDLSKFESLLQGQLGDSDELKNKLIDKLKDKLFGD